MNKKKFIKLVSLAMCVLAVVSLAGCAGKLSESDVSYAGPMLDNVLAGIKDKDYDSFSRDFSETMKTQITQDSFNSLVDSLQTQIGDYQERTFSSAANTIENNLSLTAVIYQAKFAKVTQDVKIIISFSDNNGTKLIEGLWFQ